MEENYPSNANKYKQAPSAKSGKQPKQVKRVVESGGVTMRKKSLGKRISDTFFGGADARSVWGYVMMDVLVPAAKNTITDAVTEGIERMVFGENRGGGRRSYRGSHTDYRGASGGRSRTGSSVFMSSRPDPREEERRAPMTRRARAVHDFGSIVIPSRAEAQEVLDQLMWIIREYDEVTVADLYQMVGEVPAFTDDRYGWDDLRDARVRRVSDGYLLELPSPEQLN